MWNRSETLPIMAPDQVKAVIKQRTFKFERQRERLPKFQFFGFSKNVLCD